MITTSGTRTSAALLDIQGTLLTADGTPYPGAADSVRALRDGGIAVRFVTNIDSVTIDVIRDRLLGADIDVGQDEIVSPVSAACRFLEAHGSPRVHLLVPESIEGAFSSFRASEGRRADYVVVGDCRDGFTYERLNEAFRHVRAGAEIVALQKGRYFLSPAGDTLDTGAFVSALEYAADTRAHVVGKPSTELLRMALGDLAVDPWEAIMVGDDVVTDIGGAHAVGARAVLVRTGKYSLDALERAEHKPELVLDSIADLPAGLTEL